MRKDISLPHWKALTSMSLSDLKRACEETRFELEFFGILGGYSAITDENTRKFQQKNRFLQTCGVKR